jgi:5-methylcytosine-specific restriction endonuclease McrA
MPRRRPGERCALCGRDRPLTFHHLIPRTLHRKKRYRRAFSKAELSGGVDLCRDCHDAVHRFIPEKVLGERYRTLEALRAHPEVAKFVAWVRRRPGRHRLRRPRR